jgi:hypothetical protein
MIRVEYPGPSSLFKRRQLLGQKCEAFFREAILKVDSHCNCSEDWTLHLGSALLFDSSGLRILIDSLKNYAGSATSIEFQLRLDPAAHREYYSLGADGDLQQIVIPVTASRSTVSDGGVEILEIDFNYSKSLINYPNSLSDAVQMNTPLALLMEFHGDFDILFANQIAIFSALARNVARSPMAWVRGLIRARRGTWKQRISLAYARIHPTAQVHPTAVIEGSVIGPGAKVGAHCVVRYSHIAERVQLSDGAKVEFSVVGSDSWLMHDLVLLRCHVEDDVFLIHGPYQFSCFHSRSSAFATIMMDYRPDAKPIKAMTTSGMRGYQGRFLGAVLQEGAKSLAALLSPGISIPKETWLAVDMASVHAVSRTDLPQQRMLPSSFVNRRT